MSNEFDQQRSGKGTKEWAEHNVNIGTGCSHNCLYCYARDRAVRRFKKVKSNEEWPNEIININAVNKSYPKKDGVIMFPTTHDITPYYLDSTLTVLKKILVKGNKVLIVSKPHLECVRVMCSEFASYREQILFRFTIGSLKPRVCEVWEPGAPGPEERFKSLIHANEQDFQTSVSMEPMLEGASQAIEYFHLMEMFVTDKIWIGKMNKVDQRIDISIPKNKILAEGIKYFQRDGAIKYLYENLKNHPKVAWKDSIKEVVGEATSC